MSSRRVSKHRATDDLLTDDMSVCGGRESTLLSGVCRSLNVQDAKSKRHSGADPHRSTALHCIVSAPTEKY